MIKEKAEIIFETQEAVGTKILSEGDLEIISLEIVEKGQIISHALPVDVCFFINKGTAELFIEEEEILMTKGEKIVIPYGKKRSWKNIGKDKLIITGIKFMK